jgi:Cytochrome c
MSTRTKTLLLSFILIIVTSCAETRSGYNPLTDFEQLDPTTIFAMPDAMPSPNYSTEQLQRGRYMVGLLGCGSCHTDGALVGNVNQSRLLAGSSTGIAYSSPFVDDFPGVVFPPNLTPDMETGLGTWTMERLVQMIRVGTTDHSARSVPVMPWPAFVNITEEDAFAMAAYLKSLTPVRHQVPSNVNRGQRTTAPYVHFGVYQSI